jgi:hypothetical protein
MKTTIVITGGNSGNRAILNQMRFDEMNCKDMQFGGYQIEFESEQEAVNSLIEACNDLNRDEEGSAYLFNSNKSLSYDASSAEIIETEDED